jgi:hypothetical protein
MRIKLLELKNLNKTRNVPFYLMILFGIPSLSSHHNPPPNRSGFSSDLSPRTRKIIIYIKRLILSKFVS